MVLVERAVRPLRAGPGYKNRVREELLAHLTTIFEEERARLGNDQAALAEAGRRFGDPTSLTRDLQEAVPFREVFWLALIRWLGGWPGESPARSLLRRTTLIIFGFSLLICSLSCASLCFRDE